VNLLLTETENTIIDDILELLNKHGLTSHQSMNLLERLGESLRWGSEWRRGRPVGWGKKAAVRSVREEAFDKYANWG
jgi:hypothetical protein